MITILSIKYSIMSIKERYNGRNFIKEIRQEQKAFQEMNRRNDPSFRKLKVKHLK